MLLIDVMLARPPRRPGPRVAHVPDVADLAGRVGEREVVCEAAAPQARLEHREHVAPGRDQDDVVAERRLADGEDLAG